MPRFQEMINNRWAIGARVCVGLDPVESKLGSQNLAASNRKFIFNARIIDATKHLALAYKPNIAFYSGDAKGMYDLYETIRYIRRSAPDVPIILDSKRADIGNTNAGYILEAFWHFGVDAVTVNPYFGMEAMKPFLDQKDKGIIVLCRTSNPGAGEFQDLSVQCKVQFGVKTVHRPLYLVVAEHVAHTWNYNNNCLLVVGATTPKELKKVREVVGNSMWFLLPGVGTQGGDLKQAVRNGINSQKEGIIINSSSGIIFASLGKDFDEAAKRELEKLTKEINDVLASV